MRIILFFFFITNSILGQNYEEKLYNYRNGLPANKVFDIVKDANNNIWLGTDKGLVRYDGANFVKIESNNYTNKAIRKIKTYQDKIFVFYQNGGLNEFDINSSTDKLLYKTDVNDVCLIRDSLWILHSDGVLELKTPALKLVYDLNIDKQKIINYGCLEYYQNKLFISLPKNGVYSLNIYERSIKRHNITGAGYYERFLVNDEQLYFVRTKLPQKFNRSRQIFEPVDLKKYIKDFNNDYFVHQNTNYFISDYTTFYRQHGESVIPLYKTKKYELIKSLIHNNNYYFATNKGLLRVYPENKLIESIDLHSEHEDDYIHVRRKIITSNDSIIFFGFPFIYVRKDNSSYKVTHSIASNYDAIKFKSGYLVCNDGVGLVHYKSNFKKKNVINIDSYARLNEGDFTTIYFDTISRKILLGNKKFIYILNENLKLQNKYPLPVEYAVKKIVNYSVNSYLVGTDNGLYLLHENGQFDTVDLPEGKVIGDICIDSNNSIIYVGYENGINALNYYSLKSINTVKLYDLVNPRITGMILNQNNELWCSTYSGIVCYNVDENKFITLDYTNGLLNTEFNYKSVSKLGSDRIVFGGVDGYDIIDAKLFRANNKSIKGNYSGVNLFSSSDTLYFSNPSRIDYYGHEYYARIYFSSEYDVSNSKFKYSLNDGQWISLFNKTTLDLIGLEPNDYILNLEGVDQFGNNIVFPKLEIKVRKPLLQSDGFIFSVLIFIIGLILVVTINIINNKKKLLSIYDNIAMDLHDEVGNILAHLTLLVKSRSDLNEIKLKIIDQLMAANYGLRIYINTAGKKTMNVEHFNDDLIDELKKITSAHQVVFIPSASYHANRAVAASLVRDIKLIVFEIVNNALKHSNAKQIEYNLIVMRNSMEITIQDDGFGFDVSRSYKGQGLKNIHKRVNLNEGQVVIQSDSSGTRYIITM